MKESTKRSICLILVAVLIAAITITMPIRSSAAVTNDGILYEISNGEATVTGYDGTAQEVVIPDAVGGYPVAAVGDWAFYGSSITTVTIPDSVRSIGWYAFRDSCNLETVTMGNGVTTIGDEAFGNCYNLKTISIPNSVEVLGAGAFLGCSALQGIVCENARYLGNESNPYLVLLGATSKEITSCVIEPGTRFICNAAFSGCTKLEKIAIPDSVTSIGYLAFRDCNALHGVYITDMAAWCGICFYQYDNWDTNPLYYAGNLYLNEVLITDLIIPEGVTSISSYAFYSPNGGINSVSLPKSLKSIGNCVFFGAWSGWTVYNYAGTQEQWNDVQIGSWNDNLMSKEVNMAAHSGTTDDGLSYTIVDGKAAINFYYGTEKEVVVPDEIEGCPVTVVGGFAFSYIDELETVVLGKNVMDIGFWAFGNCDNLKAIRVADDHPFFSNDENGFLYSKDKKTLVVAVNGVEHYEIPEGVQHIAMTAFAGNTLYSVSIPDSITTVGTDAFLGCINLQYSQYDGLDYLGNSNNPYFVAVGPSAHDQWPSSLHPNVKCIAGTEVTYLGLVTEIEIPVGVTHIGEGVFGNGDELQTVYYNGSKAQWDSIIIESWNESLLNATKYLNYNPDIEPTIPETTVPETTVPQTTVPETTVPQTTVPETTVPQTTVPETTVPEQIAPETTIPKATVPETNISKPTAPETIVPQTTVPETIVPETTVPETTSPETTIPETTGPEPTAPETTVPETTVPNTTAPVGPSTPQTGDLANSIIWVALLIVFGAALVVYILLRHKKESV